MTAPRLLLLALTLNGEPRAEPIDTRMLLVDALRDSFGVRSPKVGCGTGDCGACTVLIDGAVQKSCLRLAVSAREAVIQTIESLADDGRLSTLQEAFWDAHGFQCGFCLSGMLWCAADLLARISHPTDEEILDAIGGNLCRCTGYVNIVDAVHLAASRLAQDGSVPGEPTTTETT
jgi:aerobic-type carbon monoxide dehydrogenase small subunit (CoxS/CutS family)